MIYIFAALLFIPFVSGGAVGFFGSRLAHYRWPSTLTNTILGGVIGSMAFLSALKANAGSISLLASRLAAFFYFALVWGITHPNPKLRNLIIFPKIIGALAMFGGVLAVLFFAFYPVAQVKYRITLEVETPEGLKTGSAVGKLSYLATAPDTWFALLLVFWRE